MATLIAKKTDIHGRDEDAQEADKWFMAEIQRIQKNSCALKEVPKDKFNAATKGAFLTIHRVRGEATSDEKVNLLPGYYDLEKLKTLSTELALSKTSVAEIEKRLYKDATLRYGVAVSAENEGSMGRVGHLKLAPIPTGYTNITTVPAPILGTPVTFGENGNTYYGAFTSKEDYLRWLPAIQSAWAAHNTWCIDLPCERVADMADKTQEALAMLKDQLRNLHDVTIYSIAPRWLRYYSDGSMATQKSGANGIRAAAHPAYGARPLLFDGKAWVVGLKFGERMVPGRIFATEEGKFICSDWCQREVGKDGGIDLHTGEFTKHSLMSWCAGPGVSRFGDTKTQARHGTLVRPKIRKVVKKGKAMSKLDTLKAELFPLILKARAATKGAEKAPLEAGETQANSLRYSTLDFWNIKAHYIGVSVKFGKFHHWVCVPLVAPHMLADGKALQLSFGNLESQAPPEYSAYRIPDKDLVKSIVKVLKAMQEEIAG